MKEGVRTSSLSRGANRAHGFRPLVLLRTENCFISGGNYGKCWRSVRAVGIEILRAVRRVLVAQQGRRRSVLSGLRAEDGGVPRVAAASESTGGGRQLAGRTGR